MPKPREHLKPVPVGERLPAEWQLQDDTYDIHEFYTAASDRNGHKEAGPKVPMPNALMAEANEWISSRRFPQYTSLQCMLRDGLYHRLRWLQDNYGKDPRMEKVLDTWGAACRLEGRYLLIEERKQYISDLDARCKFFLQEGAQAELDETLTDAERVSERYGDPWFTQLWEVIQKYKDKRDEVWGQ